MVLRHLTEFTSVFRENGVFGMVFGYFNSTPFGGFGVKMCYIFRKIQFFEMAYFGIVEKFNRSLLTCILGLGISGKRVPFSVWRYVKGVPFLGKGM